MTEQKHRNDMYGDIKARSEAEDGVAPLIPAATVILVRNSENEARSGLEVLMLKKTSGISFGGMWVFPGGKIDPTDHEGADTDDEAAVNAVIRETLEETGLTTQKDQLLPFSHWTPPPGPQKRFTTWFFISTAAQTQPIQIDDGEIKDYRWVAPQDALDQQTAGEVDLAPPTWISLYHLNHYETVDALTSALADRPMRYYATRVSMLENGTRVALWDGDDGYPEWDANVVGLKHRLVMAKEGFTVEHESALYP